MKYIIEKVKFSQSNLDTYLHCPLRFYCQYILRLRGKEGITDDLEPKDIGSKVHAVLQKFFISKLGKKLVIKKEDYNHIEKIVEDEFNKSFTHSDVGSIYLS
jgi:ATP-dependent helicase/DNAse subunit B